MDREDDVIRSLLSNTDRKTAPAGLTEAIMQEVQELERRRVYRRVVRIVIFWTAVFIGLLLLLVVLLVRRGVSADELFRLQLEAVEGIVGILKNAYFLIPLVVLLIGRKLFAIK